MNFLFESLKYIDCFGVTFNFYTEKSRKLYTAFGGLFTILSIIGGILYFICVEYDDFSHKEPISTISESKVNNTKIKFLEEKIWIPWRIRDYNSKTINFTNLFYPIPFYYRGIYNKTKKALDLTHSVLNYSLCSETSMAKYKDLYSIDMDLEKLYCIEMDNVELGGAWESDYIFYVEFDLYICKNGINYDENNTNCSTYDKIIESAGEDNSFLFDIFLPIVHYQPFDKEKPLFVKYSNYFYHLSRFSNKIDRIFLKKYQLNDDNGWFVKQEIISSRWGFVSTSGDTYINGDKKDLANEGSSSRLFSFNIYINSDVVNYNRSYKKILLIISNGLPNINLIFAICRVISKIYGIALRRKKLSEFIFENTEKRPSLLSFSKNKILNENKNNADNTYLCLYTLFEEGMNDLKKKKNSSINYHDKYNSDKNIYIYSFKNNNSFKQKISQNNLQNIKLKNHTNGNINIYKNNKYKNGISHKNDNIEKTHYIHKKLFPFKYYLYSKLIKNNCFRKSSIILLQKFIHVYNFMCQMFDITSYIILQREFNNLKNTFILKKYKTIIGNKQKINVNAPFFNIDIEECLRLNNFSIFDKSNKKNLISIHK